MAETLAHLDVLREQGSVQQTETNEGRWWFSRT